MLQTLRIIVALTVLSLCLPARALLAYEMPRAEAPVNLQIDKWVQITAGAAIQDPNQANDEVDLVVTPSYFNNTAPVSKGAWVEVTLNFTGVLKCPYTITLYDHGSYTADAKIQIAGSAFTYDPPLDSEEPYSISLEPGAYTGNSRFNLTITVNPPHTTWSATDLAGTYSTKNGLDTDGDGKPDTANPKPLLLTVLPQ